MALADFKSQKYMISLSDTHNTVFRAHFGTRGPFRVNKFLNFRTVFGPLSASLLTAIGAGSPRYLPWVVMCVTPLSWNGPITLLAHKNFIFVGEKTFNSSMLIIAYVIFSVVLFLSIFMNLFHRRELQTDTRRLCYWGFQRVHKLRMSRCSNLHVTLSTSSRSSATSRLSLSYHHQCNQRQFRVIGFFCDHPRYQVRSQCSSYERPDRPTLPIWCL